MSPGSLDPEFSSTVISYTVALAHDVDQITIVATPAGAGSVAFTKPGFGGFGGPTPIPDADLTTDGHQVDVAPPFRGFIHVEVTETGLTETTYIVTLNRAPAPPASLTALTVTPGSLDPGFSSTVTSYTVDLAHDVDQITIVATPDGAGSVAFTEPAVFFGTTPIPDTDTTTDGHQVRQPAVDYLRGSDGNWPHKDHLHIEAEPRSGTAGLPERADSEPGVARSGVQQHRHLLHGRPGPRRGPNHHRGHARRRRQRGLCEACGLRDDADPGRRSR